MEANKDTILGAAVAAAAAAWANKEMEEQIARLQRQLSGLASRQRGLEVALKGIVLNCSWRQTGLCQGECGGSVETDDLAELRGLAESGIIWWAPNPEEAILRLLKAVGALESGNASLENLIKAGSRRCVWRQKGVCDLDCDGLGFCDLDNLILVSFRRERT
jgi:hypothetical protein